MMNSDQNRFQSWVCASGHETDRQPIPLLIDGLLVFVCSRICTELLEDEPAAAVLHLAAA